MSKHEPRAHRQFRLVTQDQLIKQVQQTRLAIDICLSSPDDSVERHHTLSNQASISLSPQCLDLWGERLGFVGFDSAHPTDRGLNAAQRLIT